MEIRIENTITIKQIRDLKLLLDVYFSLDFTVVCDGSYVYFRDN